MNLKQLMFVKAASGTPTPIPTEELTETGNPATFTTDVRKALTGLVIPFTPTQAGTGDPSPTNVRPISGLESVEIKISGHDTSTPHTFSVSFPDGVVYGGELDAVNGTLKIEWASITYTGAESESWNVENDLNFYIMTPNGFPRNTTSEKLICNMAKSDASLLDGTCKITSSGNFNIRIGTIIKIKTVSAFKEWLAENPVQIVCRITSPQTVQVDPVTIKTLIGENNVWSETNGVNTVKYLKKVQA